MKSKFFVSLIILVLTASIAFSEERYDVGCWAKQTVLADVNNDGYVDLLQPHGYDYFVSVLLNKGDGTFSDQMKYETYKDAHYITPADVDKDGWIDMVVTYLNAPYVSVYLNKGDGTFTDQISYDANSSIVPAILEDVDHDSWLDIILCWGGGGIMQILMNNGDGTFAAPIKYNRVEGTFFYQRSFMAADVDNDGSVDFVSSYWEWLKDPQFIEVYKNNGDGTFDAPDVYDPIASKVNINLTDVNNDGFRDILCSHYEDNKISVFLNKGDGTFSDPVFYETGTNPFPVTTADVNNDGWNDLLVSNYESSTVSVFINKGDGTFNSHVLYPVYAQPVQVTVSDLNKDGWIDMIITTRERDTVEVFLNNRNGTFEATGKYGPGDSYFWSPLAYDIDNDSWDDIIQCNLGSAAEEGFISIFKNIGNGKFDNSGVRIRIESVWNGSGLNSTMKLNFCSYPDKSVNVDLYFVMLDPVGMIYSGMDWNEGIIPLARGLTLPPNMQIEDLPILEFTVPGAIPPIMIPGKYTFAMALFKAGTGEMIMFLSKASFNVK